MERMKVHRILSFVVYFVNVMSLLDVGNNGYFFKIIDLPWFLGKGSRVISRCFPYCLKFCGHIVLEFQYELPKKNKIFHRGRPLSSGQRYRN